MLREGVDVTIDETPSEYDRKNKSKIKANKSKIEIKKKGEQALQRYQYSKITHRQKMQKVLKGELNLPKVEITVSP
jgi:hypothetical protein